jgi:hypothetical protein
LAGIVFNRVNGADVGMIQRRCGASFEHETLKRSGIPGKILRQKLQGHAAAESQVLGFVDNAHPAAAQLAGDFVVRDGLADHGFSRSMLGRLGLANQGASCDVRREGEV